MDDSRYNHQCPRCETAFGAVSERGRCPKCKLFFRRDRDGQLIGVIPTFDTPSKIDWPFEPVDELCAATFETAHFGGGPIFQSDRNGGYPELSVVHAQLTAKFDAITNSIRPHLPDTALFDGDLGSLPKCYSDATSARLVSWNHGDKHYQLVCYLTVDGGSVDVVIDRNADWYSRGE